MTVDVNAPIIPYTSMGGIRLYAKLADFTTLFTEADTFYTLLPANWARYEIDDSIMLFFDLANGKLFKITTQEGYKGKLPNGIGVGDTIAEMLAVDPELKFDEFEEVWISPSGYYV